MNRPDLERYRVDQWSTSGVELSRLFCSAYRFAALGMSCRARHQWHPACSSQKTLRAASLRLYGLNNHHFIKSHRVLHHVFTINSGHCAQWPHLDAAYGSVYQQSMGEVIDRREDREYQPCVSPRFRSSVAIFKINLGCKSSLFFIA